MKNNYNKQIAICYAFATGIITLVIGLLLDEIVTGLINHPAKTILIMLGSITAAYAMAALMVLSSLEDEKQNDYY